MSSHLFMAALLERNVSRTFCAFSYEGAGSFPLVRESSGSSSEPHFVNIFFCNEKVALTVEANICRKIIEFGVHLVFFYLLYSLDGQDLMLYLSLLSFISIQIVQSLLDFYNKLCSRHLEVIRIISGTCLS